MNPESFEPQLPGDADKFLQKSFASLEEEKELYLKKLQESEERLTALKEKREKLKDTIDAKLAQQQKEMEGDRQRTRRVILEHLMRGRAYLRSGHYEQALKEWEAVLLFDENHTMARKYIADCESRIEEESRQREIQEEIENQKEQERLDSLHQAKRKYREGRYEEAIEIIEKILVTHGSTPEINTVLADCEDRLREIESELIRARKESQQHKEEIAQYLNLGRQLARKGEHSRALELFEKCLVLEPDNKVAQEEIKRSELRLRTEEEEQKKSESYARRLVLEKKVKALRSARVENYERAIEILEDLLLECPEAYQADILGQIQELEQRYREYQEQENKEIEEARQKQQDLQIEKDRQYVEIMFQVESKLLEDNMREALLLLRKLQIEQPERAELEDKIQSAERRLDSRNDQKRIKELTAEEERFHCERLLGEALSLFHQGRLDASLEKLSEVLKAGRYGLVDAKALIDKIEARKKDVERQSQRGEEAIVHRILARFRQALVKDEVGRARHLLEELRYQTKMFPAVELSLEDLETEIYQKEEELSRCRKEEEVLFRESFNKGMTAYSAGHWAEAYLHFKEAHLQRGDDREVQQFRIDALRKQREQEQEQKNTRQSESDFTRGYEALKQEVRTCRDRGRYTEALEAVDRLLLQFPARLELQRIAEELSQERESYLAGQLKKQEEELKNSRLRMLTKRASHCFFQKNYAESLSLCQEILTLDPGHQAIKDLRERILENKESEERRQLQEEQEKEAEKKQWALYQREKEEAKSTELKAIHEKGLAYFEKEELESALLEWQKGLILDPAHPLLTTEISRVKRQLREREIAAVQSAEEQRRREIEVNHTWREGRARIMQENYLEAIEWLDQALAIAGRHTGIEEDLLRAENQYQIDKKNREAELRVNLEREQKLQRALFLAQRYYNNEQHAEAIDAFETVLEIDSNHIEAREGILLAEEELRKTFQKPIRGIGRVKGKRGSGKGKETQVEPPAEMGGDRTENYPEPSPVTSMDPSVVIPVVPEEKSKEAQTPARDGESYDFILDWRKQDEAREQEALDRKTLKKELNTLYQDARALHRDHEDKKAMELLEKALERAESRKIDNFLVKRMRKFYEHLAKWS